MTDAATLEDWNTRARAWFDALRDRIAPNEDTDAALMARFGAMMLEERPGEGSEGRAERAREAEPFLRECLTLRVRLYPPGHEGSWLRCNTMSMLGAALVARAGEASLSDGRRRELRLAVGWFLHRHRARVHHQGGHRRHHGWQADAGC